MRMKCYDIKFYFKIYLFFGVLFFSFFILTGSVFAYNDGYVCKHGYHTFSDYQMGYGVGQYGNNRRYYYPIGFDDYYLGIIEESVNKWVHTTNQFPYVTTSISIRKTSVKKQALFEYENVLLDPNIFGETHFWLNRNEIKLNSEGTLTRNYGWARMFIAVDSMNAAHVSRTYIMTVLSHELGHAMGLSHQYDNPFSVMCIHSCNSMPSGPGKIDCETINHIYG